MSSHYIVRENQELIIYFRNLSGPLSEPVLEVLEWAPMVWANEETTPFLESHQIRIDSTLETDEDLTQLFQEAEKRSVDSIYIVSQIDENALSKTIQKNELYLNKLNLSILDGHRRAILVTKGSYSKWYDKGEKLIVVSKSSGKRPKVQGNFESTGGTISRFFELKTTEQGLIEITHEESFAIIESVSY